MLKTMRWPQAVTCLPGAAEVASCSSGPEGGAGSRHAPVSLARGSRGAVRRCGDSRGPRSRFCRTVCASAPEWVPGQWRPSCPLTEAGREAHGGVPRSLSSLRAGGSQADVPMCRLFRNPTGFILCFGGGRHRGADGRFQRLGRGDWLLGNSFTFLAVCLSCFSELPAAS